MLTYITILIIWIVQTYDPPPWFQTGAFPLLMNIYLAYNLIFDAFLLPIDWTIVTKELSMEFFQFLKSNAGSKDDDVSLGLVDQLNFWLWVGFILNPYNWVLAIVSFFSTPDPNLDYGSTGKND